MLLPKYDCQRARNVYSKTPCLGKRLSEPSQPFSNIRMANTHLASQFQPISKTRLGNGLAKRASSALRHSLPQAPPRAAATSRRRRRSGLTAPRTFCRPCRSVGTFIQAGRHPVALFFLFFFGVTGSPRSQHLRHIISLGRAPHPHVPGRQHTALPAAAPWRARLARRARPIRRCPSRRGSSRSKFYAMPAWVPTYLERRHKHMNHTTPHVTTRTCNA